MKKIPIEHYDIIAGILYFPDENYAEKVMTCQRMLNEQYPSIARDFESFSGFIATLPPVKCEEIFMRTFDVQSLCCMDVGYVLFGEDYKRGKLLANLNQEHHQAGVDCGGELADRLPNVLKLIPRLHDEELQYELLCYVVKPALDKMIGEFLPERIRKKEDLYRKFHKAVLEKQTDEITKYRIPLQTVREMIEIDFPEVPVTEGNTEQDLLQAMQQEIKNES